MDEFFGRYRNLSVLLAVVFAQIILLGYQVRTDHGSSLIREWTVRAVTPVTKSVRGLTQWAGSGWENYFWLVGTKKDNDQLRHEVAQLKLENVGLHSSLARFEREEKLVDYQGDLASRTTLAQVIGKGANSNSREIFISRGLDAGVTSGMPVITPDGIVGKVQASYPGAALVMLISDPEAGVGVLLERSRAAGILKGTGHTDCRIDYVSHEVDVQVGETVYTSGDDRVFPKGLRIGKVVRLERGTDFQQIYLKPFAQLDRLEEVLVITAGVHQDLPESPQAQPPQFLMPLPNDEPDPLRAGAAPGASEPAAAEQPADGVAADSARGDGADSAGQAEVAGRLTDADRLRQYYESIAAKQGQKIGYGGPGTVIEFNPERLRAQHASPARGAPPAPAAPAPGEETDSGNRADPADGAAATKRPSATDQAEGANRTEAVNGALPAGAARSSRSRSDAAAGRGPGSSGPGASTPDTTGSPSGAHPSAAVAPRTGAPGTTPPATTAAATGAETTGTGATETRVTGAGPAGGPRSGVRTAVTSTNPAGAAANASGSGANRAASTSPATQVRESRRAPLGDPGPSRLGASGAAHRDTTGSGFVDGGAPPAARRSVSEPPPAAEGKPDARP